jgi:hypothetical protein
MWVCIPTQERGNEDKAPVGMTRVVPVEKMRVVPFGMTHVSAIRDCKNTLPRIVGNTGIL